MILYLLKRIGLGVLVVAAVSVLIFTIMQLMPGDPIQLISSPRVSPERVQELRSQWGLDKPGYVQYFYWLSRVLRGDFGTSISTGQKVSTLIRARLPYTLLLTGTSLVLQYLIAVPLGLLAAARRGSRLDGALVVGTIIFWSMPPFWLGILLILVFGIWLRVLPISGYSGLRSLILPLLTMTLPSLASQLRLTRSEVLEVLRERYVTTAYAKGLERPAVLTLHVLRNALIPVTILFFLSLPWLIGGSVVIEGIFAWPGMGNLLWKAISSQDYPVVQGIILIIAILTVVSNILGDLAAAALDPRIRIAAKGDLP